MMGARKVDLDVLHQMTPMDVCLNIWARWNSLADYQVSTGAGNEQDVKEFMRTGEAVECMINSLSRCQWWAIRKSKGICTAWIFKDTIFADALAEAEAVLDPLMRKHVATRRYFH